MGNNEDLKVLLKISFDIMEKLMYADIKESYQIVSHMLGRSLNWDYVEIWLKNPDEKVLKKSDIYYASTDDIRHFSSISDDKEFSYGEGVPGIAWKTKKSTWYDDIEHVDYFIRKTHAKDAKLTTCFALPIKAYDHVDAVLMFFSIKPKEKDEYMIELLNLIASRLGMLIIRSSIENEIEELRRTTQSLLTDTFTTISRIFSFRDPYTVEHQHLVTKLACEIAKRLNFDEDELHNVKIASMLHDIGKIAIPMEILSKPSKLTNEEFELIKSHVRIGASIVEDLPCSRHVKLMVLEHHERLDGSGYPDHKKGDEIYIGSQIIAVADVASAMLENRPYRAALKFDDVKEELLKYSGTKYNALIVKHTIDILDQLQN